MQKVLALLKGVYEALWKNTTGRPFTHIMRSKPVLLLLPAAVVLRLAYRNRLAFGLVGLGVGFVMGHVFW